MTTQLSIRRPVAAALAGLMLGLAGAASAEDCAAGRAAFRTPDGKQVRFTIEIADDADERAQGLMHRESMSSGKGMLFIYDQQRPVSFWMENTLIPLDMLFIDETGTVVSVHENAKPLDRTPIPSGQPVLMVLEINGGLARRLGLGEGAELHHPRLDQDLAAWPCAQE